MAAMARSARAATGVVILLLLGACTSDSGNSSSAGGRSAETACVDDGEPFEGATQLFIEHNATDGDTGVHGFLGSDGVRGVCIRTPDGTDMLGLDTVEQFRDLGVGDFFFESREPPADEYSIADLEANFPEGEYRISGIGADGTPRVGTARFTHDIPAAPVISSPRLADEENAGDAVLPTAGVVVRWEPVNTTLDGAPLTVTGYEVIVTQVEHEDPHGRSRPVYDVHVPADRTELVVVDGFLFPGTLYELEVLALEESGNQTISLGFFTTAS
jgi:hypothetical protein